MLDYGLSLLHISSMRLIYVSGSIWLVLGRKDVMAKTEDELDPAGPVITEATVGDKRVAVTTCV